MDALVKVVEGGHGVALSEGRSVGAEVSTDNPQVGHVQTYRSLNPWQRLAARIPSVFASDPHFCRKTPKAPENPPQLDMGPMSPRGERDYLLRQAARTRSTA